VRVARPEDSRLPGRALSLTIRRADPNEGERLRAIAIASKSHWGYDLGRVREWAAMGDFSPEGIRAKEVYAAEADGKIVAWGALIPRGEVCWLDDLWVDPEWIQIGVGSRLFRFVAEHGRQLGGSRMEWEAEPNAVGFYERMGGRYLRDGETSAWGRVLPVMGIELEPKS
jgi:GNAT superfamily N-acetyltransferase